MIYKSESCSITAYGDKSKIYETYSGSGKPKPKKTKLLYWMVAAASVIDIALSVTLAIVFSRTDVPVVAPPVDEGGNVEKPEEKPPVIDTDTDKIKFGLPVENGTVIREGRSRHACLYALAQ